MSQDRTENRGVTIRPLLQGEIAVVERNLPFDSASAGRYYEYFTLQNFGEAVDLIAWHSGLPVGHALLRWRGTRTEPIASQLKDCPHISSLHVHPDCRSQGIGSLLLDRAEELALDRGYHQVGLSVDVANVRAQALYERRGYRDAGFAPCRRQWSFLDRTGRAQSCEEICLYLIKPLIPR